MAFGDLYISRMREIWSLTEPHIEHDAIIKDGMYHSFRAQYEKARVLAGENTAFIREEVLPLLSGEKDLTPETFRQMAEFSKRLVYDENLMVDRVLCIKIQQMLLEYAQAHDDRTNVLFYSLEEALNFYHMMAALNRDDTIDQSDPYYHYQREGQRLIGDVLKYLPLDKFTTLSEAEQKIVMRASRFAWLFYQSAEYSAEEFKQKLQTAVDALNLSRDPAYRAACPTLDWQLQESCCLYYLALCSEYLQVDQPNDPVSMAIIYSAATTLVDKINRGEQIVCTDADEAKQLLGRIRLRMGDISSEVYLHDLYDQYNLRNPSRYDYEGIQDNLLLPSHIMEMLALRQDETQRNDMLRQLYRDICHYTLYLPNNDMQEFMLNYALGILFDFLEIPGSVTFAEMCDMVLANFAPATYVHSQMVGRIAQALGDMLIDREPERFIGLCDCASVQQVVMRKQRILHLLYQCGIYHDVGKLSYLDTINVTYRPVFDEEMDIIRLHPIAGYKMLKKYPSTSPYAEPAWTHHLWYDGSRGYPAGVERSQLAYPVLTDIIAVADCMDAATDTIFRSYNKGITLETYISEVRQGAGTRYAPYVADLLTDPQMVCNLRTLLDKGREEAYLCAYRIYRSIVRESGRIAEHHVTEPKPFDAADEERRDADFAKLFAQMEESEDACEKLRQLVLANISSAKVQAEYIPRFQRLAEQRHYVYGQAVGYAMEFWRTHSQDIDIAMKANEEGFSRIRRVDDWRHTPCYLSLINNAVLGYVIRKQYAEAYHYARMGLQSLNEHMQNPAFYYALLNNTSMILSDVGLLNRAKHQLEESLKGVDQMTARNAMATKYRYAEVLLANGEFDRAQSMYLEMLSQARIDGEVEPWQVISRLVVLAYRRKNGVGLRYWSNELNRARIDHNDKSIDDSSLLYADAVCYAWIGDYDAADKCFSQLVENATESLLDQTAILQDAAEFYDSFGRTEKSHGLYIRLHECHQRAVKVIDELTSVENEMVQKEASHVAYERLFNSMKQVSDLTQALVACVDYDEVYQQLLTTLPSIVTMDAMLLMIRSGTGELSFYPAEYANNGTLTDAYDMMLNYRELKRPTVLNTKDPLLRLLPPGVAKESGSLLLAPLVFRKNNLGYLLLYSNESAAYGRGSCKMLSSISMGVSVAMSNIGRYFEAAHRANCDALTGIANRNGFFGNVDECMQGEAVVCALCMIDIDNFKQVNDTYGHSIGDQVLKKLATLLEGIRKDGIAARYGGEEFVLLAPLAEGETMGDVGESVRAASENTIYFDGQPAPITVSVGVCEWRPGMDVMDMLKHADQLMYQAKHTGKNRVCFL